MLPFRFGIIIGPGFTKSTSVYEMRTKTFCTFGSFSTFYECGVRCDSFFMWLLDHRIQNCTWKYCSECKRWVILVKHFAIVSCSAFSIKLFLENLNRSFAVEEKRTRNEQNYCPLVRFVGTTVITMTMKQIKYCNIYWVRHVSLLD